VSDRLIRITTGAAVATRRRGGRSHLLPARLRTGQHPRRDRGDRPARPVHRRRPDPRREHAHPRREAAAPARIIPGALVPRCGHPGHDRRQPGSRPGPRPHRCPGQRAAGRPPSDFQLGVIVRGLDVLDVPRPAAGGVHDLHRRRARGGLHRGQIRGYEPTPTARITEQNSKPLVRTKTAD